MTIICIRGFVVAADSSASRNDICLPVNYNKLARSKDGAVAGACGLAAVAKLFTDWFRSTDDPQQRARVSIFERADAHDLHAIWLERDGSIWHMGSVGVGYCVNETFASTGVSEDFALGAMAAGASAEDAVRLMIQYSDGCRGPIRVERVEPLKAEEPVALADMDPVEVIENRVGEEAEHIAHEVEAMNGKRAELKSWRERQGL